MTKLKTTIFIVHHHHENWVCDDHPSTIVSNIFILNKFYMRFTEWKSFIPYLVTTSIFCLVIFYIIFFYRTYNEKHVRTNALNNYFFNNLRCVCFACSNAVIWTPTCIRCQGQIQEIIEWGVDFFIFFFNFRMNLVWRNERCLKMN